MGARLSDEVLERLFWAFMPLVRACARRYCGRGAEYEDLVQEGCAALLELIPRCPEEERRNLPLFLKRRLPGRVRDAAAAWRRRPWESLEEWLELGREPAAEDSRAFEILLGLDGAERELAEALAAGETQGEIARRLGVSQQAVSRRIGRLRERLSCFRAETATRSLPKA